MTCIVGIVDKERHKVVIGGDSAGVAGTNIFIRKDTKVFRNGDFIIGCTSSYRMIQLLRFSFIPPEIMDKEIYKYMCTDFINEVRKVFFDGGYLQRFTEGNEQGGVFLVGYKNRLFKVDCDFQVGENINGIDACGCGQDFALGSLYTTKENKISTKKKVLRALESAEYLAVGVLRPFVLLET